MLSEEKIINRLNTLLNSNVVIADNIEVDRGIFKDTIDLILQLKDDLKLKNEILIKLAIKGLIKDE